MEEERIPGIHGDSSVVTLVVTMTIHPEKEQEFVDFAAATARTVHESEPDTSCTCCTGIRLSRILRLGGALPGC
jgi:hypothetical protein